ncbi:MAG: plasmid mobilization relaxosome protein MobC [Pseudonocardiaceae bacterium]
MAADAASDDRRAEARTGARRAPTAPAGAVKRTRTVAVRLTEAEEAAWIEAALADGHRQLGAWVRVRAVAGYLGKVRSKRGGGLSAESVAELAAVRQELVRWGNNLNQIAKAVNSGQVPSGLEPHLRDHWDKYPKLLGRLADRLDALDDRD